jgi:hypothetical protein
LIKIFFIFILGDYGDSSLSSQYHLIINIDDENDCAPTFTQLNYRLWLSNSSPIGSFISQIQAIDDDYSRNFGLIQYKLVENDYQSVSIDLKCGSLFLAKRPSTRMKSDMIVVSIDQHNHSL